MFKKWDTRKPIFINDSGPLIFYLGLDYEDDFVYRRWVAEIEKYGGIVVDEPNENTINLILHLDIKFKTFKWDVYDCQFIIDSIKQKKLQEPNKYKLELTTCFGPSIYRCHLQELKSFEAPGSSTNEEKIIGIIRHDPSSGRPDVFYPVNSGDDLGNKSNDCLDKNAKNENKKISHPEDDSENKLNNFDEDKNTKSTRPEDDSDDKLSNCVEEKKVADKNPKINHSGDDVENNLNDSVDGKHLEDENKKISNSGDGSVPKLKDCVEEKKVKDKSIKISNEQSIELQSSPDFFDSESTLFSSPEKIVEDKMSSPEKTGLNKEAVALPKLPAEEPPNSPEISVKKENLTPTRQEDSEDDLSHVSGSDDNFSWIQTTQKPITQKEPVVKEKSKKKNNKIDSKRKKPSSLEFFLSNSPESIEEAQQKKEEKIPQKKKTNGWHVNEEKSPEMIKRKSSKIIKNNSKPGPSARKIFGLKCKEIPLPSSSDEELENSFLNNEVKKKTKQSKPQISAKKRFSNTDSESDEATPPKKIRRLNTVQKCKESSSEEESKKDNSSTQIRKINFNRPSTSRDFVTQVPPSKNRRRIKSRVLNDSSNSDESMEPIDDSSADENVRINKKYKKPPVARRNDVAVKQPAKPSAVQNETEDFRVEIVNGRKVQIPCNLEEPYPRSWMVGNRLYFRSDLDRRPRVLVKKKIFQDWEQDAMIRFVWEKKYFHRTGSRDMWQEMIITRPNEVMRSEGSLKEHWKLMIAPDIDRFELPERVARLMRKKKK